MFASLLGREPGSRGTSAVGSRCQATLVKAVKSSLKPASEQSAVELKSCSRQ
jgi:hypothetical protein